MSQYCSAGHYNSGNRCEVCPEDRVGPGGFESCTQCTSPRIPNAQRTQCVTTVSCRDMGGEVVGYMSNPPDWEQCLCPAGQGPSGRAGRCEKCPGGQYSNQSYSYTSRYIGCTGCPTGQVANMNQTNCQSPDTCATQTPNAEAFNNQCYCKAGFGLSKDQTSCQECKASWYSPQGSNVCAECPANKVSAAGSHSCTTCVQNAEYPNEARSACLCAGGYGSSDGNPCTRCPAGTYHPEDPHEHGKVSCQNCQAGYFSHAGETACRACPAGTMSKERSDQCIKCPDGSISTDQGSAECKQCDSETQVPNESKTACLCIAGYYMSGSSCVACPENQISSQGSISCTPCKSGEIPNDDKTQCVPVEVQDQQQEQKQQAQGPPVGIIAGVVAGVLVAVAAIAITVVVIKRRKNKLVASVPKTRGRQVVASATRRTRHVSLIGSDFMPAQ